MSVHFPVPPETRRVLKFRIGTLLHRFGSLVLLIGGQTWTDASLGTDASDVINADQQPGLTQRVYIWQRSWTQGLRQSVDEIAPAFAALDVLAAEISWRDSAPVVSHITPDWQVLQAGHQPVGLVVRIGPNTGSWEANSAQVRIVVETCRAILDESRHHGVNPAELQLDFDAATARLSAYRALLQTVRREVRPPRLVITALPDWLSSADFGPLIRETDGYVLQVHSLEKPRTISESYALCDPPRAAEWIARAARIGHPFRIALPTYGYRLIFDAAGKFTALEAEGPARIWPASHQSRIVMADHTALALFVQRLLASPPNACEGLVWFRFPISDDELAWSWSTLHAVMQGAPPEAHLALLAEATPAGTLDLFITNQGTASAEPAAFRVEWREAQLLVADVLGGWQLERLDRQTLVVRPPPHGSNGLLRPGESFRLGWMRLDRPASLTATLMKP